MGSIKEYLRELHAEDEKRLSKYPPARRKYIIAMRFKNAARLRREKRK